MASTKKTSSKSKSISPSSKKNQIRSPMKKQLSQNTNSPKKSNAKTMKKRVDKTSRHPNYQHMVTEALKTLNSRTGSTRSKILNHMKHTYGIENGKSVNNYLRTALETLLEESVISLAKGTNYNNAYYRIATKGSQQNKKRSLSPKKVQRRLSPQSRPDDVQKKTVKKSTVRSRSRTEKQQQQTDHQRRSRTSSKGRSRSSIKNNENQDNRGKRESSKTQSHSPSKTKSSGSRKSTSINPEKSRRSISRSPTKSKMNKKSQQKESGDQNIETKTSPRGRSKVGQKRQALKEVNDRQDVQNSDKKQEKLKLPKTGKNVVGHSSPTRSARKSVGSSTKKRNK